MVAMAALAVCLVTYCAKATPQPGLKAFVFQRIDSKRQMAILVPMTPINVGVQIKTGSKVALDDHEVLYCRVGDETSDVEVAGEKGQATEVTLTCGKRVFVVKGLDFGE